jgi:hypothetical protein
MHEAEREREEDEARLRAMNIANHAVLCQTLWENGITQVTVHFYAYHGNVIRIDAVQAMKATGPVALPETVVEITSFSDLGDEGTSKLTLVDAMERLTENLIEEREHDWWHSGIGVYTFDTNTRAMEFGFRRFGKAEQSAIPITSDSLVADQWNAVRLHIPNDASLALLTAAQKATFSCIHDAHAKVEDVREDRRTPSVWQQELYEQDWLRALNRFEELTLRIGERLRQADPSSIDVDAVERHSNVEDRYASSTSVEPATANERFSLYSWRPDGRYYKDLEYVDAQTVGVRALELIENPTGHHGPIDKLMVTDGLDHSRFEWEQGNGIVHNGLFHTCLAEELSNENEPAHTQSPDNLFENSMERNAATKQIVDTGAARAIASYEADCASLGTTPTDAGRAEWVREWAQLEAESRANAHDAQSERDRDYYKFDHDHSGFEGEQRKGIVHDDQFHAGIAQEPANENKSDHARTSDNLVVAGFGGNDATSRTLADIFARTRESGGTILLTGDPGQPRIIGSQNFGFEIRTDDDLAAARRLMEAPIVRHNERGLTSIGRKDCLHLSLTWTPGYELPDAEKITASQQALSALDMTNARAIFVARRDAMHIIADRIDPISGQAYADHIEGAKVMLAGDPFQIDTIEHSNVFDRLRNAYGVGVLSDVKRTQDPAQSNTFASTHLRPGHDLANFGLHHEASTVPSDNTQQDGVAATTLEPRHQADDHSLGGAVSQAKTTSDSVQQNAEANTAPKRAATDAAIHQRSDRKAEHDRARVKANAAARGAQRGRAAARTLGDIRKNAARTAWTGLAVLGHGLGNVFSGLANLFEGLFQSREVREENKAEQRAYEEVAPTKREVREEAAKEQVMVDEAALAEARQEFLRKHGKTFLRDHTHEHEHGHDLKR